MSFFGTRQRRFRCFYCNTSVARPRQRGPVRQLECPNCLAVNYFDENGDITDPPLDSTAAPPARVQYARDPGPRGISASGAFVFCEQCQRHQSMLHIAKSNLNPPMEGTPEYDQFKEHLRQLEIRYPQVCSFCRPGARKRIKESMHDARSRQMLNVIKDTRAGRIDGMTGWARLWRSVVLSMGGWGWFIGITGHNIWHILGARTTDFSVRGNVSLDDLFAGQTYQECTLHLYEQLIAAQIDGRVYALASSWLPAMLIVSLLTFWWNPRLRQKYIDLSRGRLVGLRDYYVTELILIALRISSFLLLVQPSRTGLDSKTSRNLHVISALIITTLAIRACSNVRLTTKPPVQFRRLDDADILPETPRVSRAGPILEQTDPDHPLIAARRGKPKFDLSMLSSTQGVPPAQAGNAPSRWPEPYAAQQQPNHSSTLSLSRHNLQSHNAASRTSLPTPPAEPDSTAPIYPTSMDIDPPAADDSPAQSFTAALRADLPHYALRSRTTPAPQARLSALRRPQPQQQAHPPSPRDPWTAHRRPRDAASAADDATTDASAPDVRSVADLDEGTPAPPEQAPPLTQAQSQNAKQPRAELVLQQPRLWLPADTADTGLEDIFAQVLGSTAFAEPEDDDAGAGAGTGTGTGGIAAGSSATARQARARAQVQHGGGGGGGGGGAAGWIGGAVAASVWAGVLGGVWAGVKAYRA